MQLTKQQFHENLLAALHKAAPEKTFNGELFKLVIVPVNEPNAKHTSVDDYLRLTLFDEKNLSGRFFDAEGVATFLSGPNSSYPLWIDVLFKEQTADYSLFELKTSMRFRKPSELKNTETGHPPFKVIQ
jgi:hypothetical protein